MKRATHLMLGAAVAMPIAATVSWPIAIGAVWWGMVGGGLPDWFDLRSEFRGSLRLRHRGASHGVPFAIGATLLWWALLGVLARDYGLTPAATVPWTSAFAAGIATHLLSDACTRAGIQPWLPLSARRFWLLPRLIRGRSSGWIDGVVRALASAAIVILVLDVIRSRW